MNFHRGKGTGDGDVPKEPEEQGTVIEKKYGGKRNQCLHHSLIHTFIIMVEKMV